MARNAVVFPLIGAFAAFMAGCAVMDTGAFSRLQDEMTGLKKEMAVLRTATPPAPAEQLAAAAEAGVAVTEERPSRFDDVRFDFDKSEVREDGRKTCQVVADYLRKNPKAKLQIEGHCDERGTAEYNLALGERRAAAVMTYLVSLGVSKGALSTVSFGKERPLDTGHDEGAWAKNRRAHFVLK